MSLDRIRIHGCAALGVILLVGVRPASADDCNSNGILDECDVDCGTTGGSCDVEGCGLSFDCNSNGIPDECELAVAAVQEARLAASDARPNDLLGWSVCIGGDVAVVGAIGQIGNGYDDPGAAYVFRYNGSNWVQEAKLTASDAAPSDDFGYSVSIAGSVAVIGAPYDGDAGYYSGSAYVFRFDGVAWVQEAKLTASDAAGSDYFGRSVSISGDAAVIGAYGDDDAASYSGSAYVFRYDGATWVQEAKLTASDAAKYDYFGRSVSISGDAAVVGAHGNDDAGSSSGSTYVFRFNGATWVQEAKLTASDAAEYDYFGCSVSISGDVAAVGADGNDDAGDSSGSAYVFRFNGATWVQEAKLTAFDPVVHHFFGDSVSISGDRAIVGTSYGYAETESASAYVYGFDGSDWVQESKLTASDAAPWDYFGRSVSINGSVAAVGARNTDHAGTNSGSAYVFVLRADCNSNGVLDECDIAEGTSGDCNLNRAPDECDVGVGRSLDGNSNGVPDECETDCNTNGVYDAYDVTGGTSEDCGSNGVPDECEPDCNSNGDVDACDIDRGTSLDCNINGVPDECEPPDDCNSNDVQDICDLAAGTALDCDFNGVLDGCDIAAGTHEDTDGNGVPDLCERDLAGYWRFDFLANTGCYVLDQFLSGTRYLRFDANNALIESWILTGGQYFKLNYPSIDGPSCNRFESLGEVTANTDRTIVDQAFTPHLGLLYLRERVLVTDGTHMGESEQTPEQGITQIEGQLAESGAEMSGTYEFREELARFCGDFTATRLTGLPPDLPCVIDLEMAGLMLNTTGLARPGAVDVVQRDYRVRASFLSSPLEVRYFLSTDPTPDEDDTLMGSESISPGPDGMLGLHSGAGPTLAVPACVPLSDDYYVLAVVDAGEVVSETDEANNVVAVPVTIGPPAVMDLDCDGDVDLGDLTMFADCLTGPRRPTAADHDDDGDVDLDDFAAWLPCLAGPGEDPGAGCEDMDRDADVDVDLADFAVFQELFTGSVDPLPPGCGPADSDADHDVDLKDFAVFQAVYTG